MFATLALAQSFVKHMRRGVVEVMLTHYQEPRSNDTSRRAPPSQPDEQRDLDNWLFDRESR